MKKPEFRIEARTYATGFDFPEIANAVDFPIETLFGDERTARTMLEAFFKVVVDGIVEGLQERDFFKVVAKENTRVIE